MNQVLRGDRPRKISDIPLSPKAVDRLAPLKDDLRLLISASNYETIVKNYLYHPLTRYDTEQRLNAIGLRLNMPDDEVIAYFN